MKIEKLVNQIAQKLNIHNITHEVLGDKYTFAYSPTCTIHTNNCTIEIVKDQITVNEKPVNDIEEMIDEVLEVEEIYS